MSRFSGIMAATKRVEQLTAVRVVRSGLINMIPVLIIGAFSLILQTLPLPVYQDFVTNFAGGILLDLFRFVYSAATRRTLSR